MNLEKLCKELSEAKAAVTMLDQAVSNLEASVEARKILEARSLYPYKSDDIIQSNELIDARIHIANMSVRLISQFSDPSTMED